MKAAPAHHSPSDLESETLRLVLEENREDLAAFEERMDEPTISYEALRDDLKALGKL